MFYATRVLSERGWRVNSLLRWVGGVHVVVAFGRSLIYEYCSVDLLAEGERE